MSRADRMALIQQIEVARNSRVLVAVWGDRLQMETKIAFDAQPVFFRHLQEIGDTEKIDVFMYSTGGLTLAAWGLANLIRQFAPNIGVLVPYKAYSAATLFALGANDIVMSRLGQLSPIDPSITAPLGPSVETPQAPGHKQVVPVSVEDVVGFLNLARDEAKLEAEESLRQVFERLSSEVHPLALGAVYRSRLQIQDLSDRLLSFHMPEKDRDQREAIVEILTRSLGSHDYLIGRREAKEDLGLNVADSNPEIEGLIDSLFGEYVDLLELNSPYNPESFLGTQNSKYGVFNRAIIESEGLTDVFRSKSQLKRVQVTQQGLQVPGVQDHKSFEQWDEDKTI